VIVIVVIVVVVVGCGVLKDVVVGCGMVVSLEEFHWLLFLL